MSGNMKRDEAWFAEYNAKRTRWQTGGNVDFNVPIVQPARRIFTDAVGSQDCRATVSHVTSRGAGARPVLPAERPAAPASALTPMERDVLAAVLGLAMVHPRVAWAVRMNSGGMNNASGQYVKFAFKGCSDIIGQMKDGRFLAIEVKRPGGKPTEDQLAFIYRVRGFGGCAFVAWSADDAIRGLAEA